MVLVGGVAHDLMQAGGVKITQKRSEHMRVMEPGITRKMIGVRDHPNGDVGKVRAWRDRSRHPQTCTELQPKHSALAQCLGRLGGKRGEPFALCARFMQRHADLFDAIEQQLALGQNVGGEVAAHGFCSLSHILNTPNVVSGTGALSAAEKASANTRRVSEGAMMPSSHSRAVA